MPPANCRRRRSCVKPRNGRWLDTALSAPRSAALRTSVSISIRKEFRPLNAAGDAAARRPYQMFLVPVFPGSLASSKHRVHNFSRGCRGISVTFLPRPASVGASLLADMTSKSFLYLALLLASVTPAFARIIGTNTPSQPITAERIAQLPWTQRGAWKKYLDHSGRQLAAD